MKEYSIVIPAYNEADKISSTLTQVVSFMRTFSQSYEVIVVDDGSRDTTADMVAEFQKNNPEVLVVRNPHKGKSYAVYTGITRAEGDLIYICDADLSTPITELKKLVVWAKDQDFDVVIGSREGKGAQRIGEPAYRHMIGRIFNMLVQVLALPGIKDSQCGFKLLKNNEAKHIFNNLIVYGPEAKITQKPFFGAFDVEVLYLARKYGYKIKEVPVIWRYVKTTRLNFIENSYKMARDVMKIRLNDIRGKYKVEA
ncbi:glycosyltransferase family 2 protein [candidate division WWE3 bacterium]|jgi:glycosyltransferase involved in cell wall biosynthesis|uniref:dolichyl-phosphate beta-glucosyltransferase n=1 Tax=candidate division WWE3 bacterium TaxID=2053526 RepID=A0A3A4ZIN3_UNCKA|nr:MAG: glycosyltransferase family 2 protein [candidate division WWE3 bacterium]